MGAARSIWSSIMQSPGRGSQSKFWIAYLKFERDWGDVKHFVRICRMAINSISESSETVFSTIQRLAAEIGLSTNQFHELQSRIRSHQLQLDHRRRVADAGTQEVSTNTSQATVVVDNSAAKSNVSQKPIKADVSGKKRVASVKKETIPTKKSKIDNPSISASSSSSVPIPVPREPVPHDPLREKRTVFVSNLDYSVNEEQLRAIFESCGKLSSVRLVRDYAGRSKGYAYVEFEEEQSVPVALEKDRQPVAGTTDLASDTTESTSETDQPLHFARPMFVSRYDPTGTKTGSGFRFEVGREEPQKLFVRHLDKRVTKEALETLFGQVSAVGDFHVIRIGSLSFCMFPELL
ncbi:unnamed protein product [Echinostoma caproni]|uniref:RRM domain-containing protein n=1 Tax=Echinostoma caproni TaxID=27848 RepID=A0A183AY84_9TREM|nr:unnamed protein product [Echinostoma caproni]